MGKKITVSELGNLRGQRFGHWRVLDSDPVHYPCRRNNRQGKLGWHWQCACTVCGKEYLIQHYALTRGLSTGCKACATAIKNRSRFNRFRAFPAPEDIGLNALYNRYIRGAKSRHLPFDLPPETFRMLVTAKCYYCGFGGREYVYNGKIEKNSHIFFGNGIDRVNNALGYTESNCVTCCDKCNNKKLGTPEYILDKVIAHRGKANRKFTPSDGMLYV